MVKSVYKLNELNQLLPAFDENVFKVEDKSFFTFQKNISKDVFK